MLSFRGAGGGRPRLGRQCDRWYLQCALRSSHTASLGPCGCDGGNRFECPLSHSSAALPGSCCCCCCSCCHISVRGWLPSAGCLLPYWIWSSRMFCCCCCCCCCILSIQKPASGPQGILHHHYPLTQGVGVGLTGVLPQKRPRKS